MKNYSELNTSDLLREFLADPFLVDYFAFPDPDAGLGHLKKTIDSAAAFFSREDAVSAAQEILPELSEEDADDCLRRRILLHFLGEVPASALGYAIASVKTPKGSDVNVWLLDEEFSQAEKDTITRQIEAAYPTATVLSDATSTYNCHSYAWYHSSDQWNRYWMNRPDTYMTDGSYTQIPALNQCQDGDIIYYGTPGDEHSGVLCFDPAGGYRVLSKWGKSALVLHPVTDCPYNSSNLSYYRCNYKKGYVDFVNHWGVALEELCVRHRRGNKEQLEDMTNCLNIPNNSTARHVLTFYYENGLGAPFDYWWIKFKINGSQEYKIKDNFFCNITKNDDGTATLTISGDNEKLKVAFSESSSDTTGIVPVS